MGKKAAKIPPRAEVPASDRWDLSSLFASDQAWEESFGRWEARVDEYGGYRGRLSESAAVLAECLRFDRDFDRQGEQLGAYAFLKAVEDLGESRYQGMKARYLGVASRGAQAASFLRPELLAIGEPEMAAFLESDELAEFRFQLEQILRYRPHTLSAAEEKLLALQIEMADAAHQVFDQLNHVDLRFGTVKDDKRRVVELSHASYQALLHSEVRKVRKRAFSRYYDEYADHAHTLAAALTGSIQRDIYYARARGYSSAIAAALFEDNIPIAIYDNLVATVRRHLPVLHRYHALRRKGLGVRRLHAFDNYVPLIPKLEIRHTWEEAVGLVLRSIEPLGAEYIQVLKAGLEGSWCDRYENQGKQSGAFSYGVYDSHPFILMNYKEDVLDHVFTLTHEAGHAMHSHFSCQKQPFQYHSYRIFVAEVASTFNEQLLSHYLLAGAKDARTRAYYLNREIDDIRATLFRQTMFAEFERQTHSLAEENEPLTLERYRGAYRELLEAYLGPDFAIDDVLELECLRIPHFYRAFYVYKYATGMSAAIALARRVLDGGEKELAEYRSLLEGGGSKYPLDLLRAAGVDMSEPEPIEQAMAHFENLVTELEELM